MTVLALNTLIICGIVLISHDIIGILFFVLLAILIGLVEYAVHQSYLDTIEQEIRKLTNYIYLDHSIAEDRGTEKPLDEILEEDIPEIEYVGEENHIPSIE